MDDLKTTESQRYGKTIKGIRFLCQNCEYYIHNNNFILRKRNCQKYIDILCKDEKYCPEWTLATSNLLFDYDAGTQSLTGSIGTTLITIHKTDLNNSPYPRHAINNTTIPHYTYYYKSLLIGWGIERDIPLYILEDGILRYLHPSVELDMITVYQSKYHLDVILKHQNLTSSLIEI